MAKEFNTAVTCNPSEHYMVDVTNKMKVFERLIDRRKYFTITRARQFGKTSALNWIAENLSDEYLVIPASFENTSKANWVDDKSFYDFFCENMATAEGVDEKVSKFWEDAKMSDTKNFKVLAQTVTDFCKHINKKIVLTIDEVDKSLDNELFLNFLSMLRNLYLVRERIHDNTYTFWSVILAGVYDVKNLKIKIRPDEDHKYNSPWNVAADYTLDMTFNPQEISTMLADYENDYHFGFNVMEIAEEIYKYTSGYPVLVSAVCKVIDENLDKQWTKNSVQMAVKHILDDDNFTLLDDISKNLQLYPELHDFLYDIAIKGRQFNYTLIDPIIKLAKMFSYIKKVDGNIAIHNLIFEEALTNYFIAEYNRKHSDTTPLSASDYIVDGDLDMEHVIWDFRKLLTGIVSLSQKFVEQNGRLLFLCFLKPIINGTGFCYFEPQTKSGGRMDLVVTYNRKEYIIELKIWRGDKYETDGKIQLSNYLKSRNLNSGYLVTFSFLKEKSPQEVPEWIEYNGKRIYEAVIDCGSKE